MSTSTSKYEIEVRTLASRITQDGAADPKFLPSEWNRLAANLSNDMAWLKGDLGTSRDIDARTLVSQFLYQPPKGAKIGRAQAVSDALTNLIPELAAVRHNAWGIVIVQAGRVERSMFDPPSLDLSKHGAKMIGQIFELMSTEPDVLDAARSQLLMVALRQLRKTCESLQARLNAILSKDSNLSTLSKSLAEINASTSLGDTLSNLVQDACKGLITNISEKALFEMAIERRRISKRDVIAEWTSDKSKVRPWTTAADMRTIWYKIKGADDMHFGETKLWDKIGTAIQPEMAKVLPTPLDKVRNDTNNGNLGWWDVGWQWQDVANRGFGESDLQARNRAKEYIAYHGTLKSLCMSLDPYWSQESDRIRRVAALTTFYNMYCGTMSSFTACEEVVRFIQGHYTFMAESLAPLLSDVRSLQANLMMGDVYGVRTDWNAVQNKVKKFGAGVMGGGLKGHYGFDKGAVRAFRENVTSGEVRNESRSNPPLTGTSAPQANNRVMIGTSFIKADGVQMLINKTPSPYHGEYPEAVFESSWTTWLSYPAEERPSSSMQIGRTASGGFKAVAGDASRYECRVEFPTAFSEAPQVQCWYLEGSIKGMWVLDHQLSTSVVSTDTKGAVLRVGFPNGTTSSGSLVSQDVYDNAARTLRLGWIAHTPNDTTVFTTMLNISCDSDSRNLTGYALSNSRRGEYFKYPIGRFQAKPTTMVALAGWRQIKDSGTMTPSIKVLKSMESKDGMLLTAERSSVFKDGWYDVGTPLVYASVVIVAVAT